MSGTAWATFWNKDPEDHEDAVTDGIAHIVGLEQRYGPTFVICGKGGGLYETAVYDDDGTYKRCPACEELVD